MSDNWIDAAALADVPEGDVVGVRVAGKEIALYEVEGEVFATDNICTHGHARMSDGFLEGREIECPLHQGKFDVCTGQALCAPLECVVGPHRDMAAVVVESSSFNRVQGDVYQFAVTLKSRADVPLEAPAVELTLTDVSDQPVLRRVFLPQDFRAPDQLPAQGEWSASLLARLALGNTTVAGYRVLAFYP